eukprot:485520-Rhodomonas_salina.3
MERTVAPARKGSPRIEQHKVHTARRRASERASGERERERCHRERETTETHRETHTCRQGQAPAGCVAALRTPVRAPAHPQVCIRTCGVCVRACVRVRACVCVSDSMGMTPAWPLWSVRAALVYRVRARGVDSAGIGAAGTYMAALHPYMAALPPYMAALHP